MSSDAASGLLGPLFGDAEVSAHLSDHARIQAMLEVEAALAEVEADSGVIPRQAVAGTPDEYVDAVLTHTLRLLATVTSVDDVAAAWQ